jgi:hypothetical protein
MNHLGLVFHFILCFEALHAQTVGDVAPGSLRGADDAHHLPTPHAVVPAQGVRGVWCEVQG